MADEKQLKEKSDDANNVGDSCEQGTNARKKI